MSTSRSYPKEVRERAVRLVFANQQDYPSQWAAISSIASRTGMTLETLGKWVRQAERDNVRELPPLPSSEAGPAQHAIGSGLRLREIFCLRWHDVDLSTGRASVLQTLQVDGPFDTLDKRRTL
jgi:transposase-like protein